MPSTHRSPALKVAVLALVLLLTACGGAESRRASHMERGQKFYAAGNYEKARVEFRNALQITPNDAEARFMNGRVAEQLGDIRAAASMYQGAIDIAPDHAGARANLGRVMVFAGQPAHALEIVEPGLAKHPNDAELLTVRGAARMQLKDSVGAMADAKRAVEIESDNANAVALLASLYRQSGDSGRALALLKNAVTKRPDAIDLRQVLASLYVANNEPALAEEQMRKVVEQRPDALAHRTQLALLYVRDKKIDAAEKVMRDATTALPESMEAKLAYVDFVSAQRSRERGEEVLRQFIAREPKNLELQLGLGALQQRTGQGDAALATYAKIIENGDDGPAALTAQNRVASIRVARGELDKAATLIDATLAKNPRDNDALILRASIALERQDAAGAIGDLRAVLRDQPGAVGVLRELARAHLQNGEPALAEDTIRSAMDVAPADVQVRVELAQLLAQTNRAEQAVSLLEETVTKAPASIPAREALVRAYLSANNLAQAHVAVGDLQLAAPQSAAGPYLAGIIAQEEKHFDEAAASFAKALELQPTAMDALAALTRLDLQRGQTEQAQKRVAAIVSAHQENAIARNLLGELQIGAKSWPAAIETLTTTTKLAPKWWLPYRNLAYAHMASGDKAGAVKVYETGIAATKNQPMLVADLAALYERDGRIDDAIRQYQALHDSSPRLELAANNLAMLLVTYKKDRTSLDRARALTAPFADSKNGALLDTHGWVMFKLGQYTEALPVLERAVELAPQQNVIRFHLGMAQLKSGQQDKARGNLEAALTGTGNFTGADEARTVLASLGRRTG